MLKLGCFGEKGRRKEKGSWMAGWPEWATAHFLVSVVTEKVCRDWALWALCRNRLFFVATGRAGKAHDRACASATVRARQGFSAPRRDRILCLNRVGLGLGDQGHDRGSLLQQGPLDTSSRHCGPCRHQVGSRLEALCRDIKSISRQRAMGTHQRAHN